MKLVLAFSLFVFVGCNSLKKLTDGAETTPPQWRSSIEGQVHGTMDCVDITDLGPRDYYVVRINGGDPLDGGYQTRWPQLCFGQGRDEVNGIIYFSPVTHADDHYRISWK